MGKICILLGKMKFWSHHECESPWIKINENLSTASLHSKQCFYEEQKAKFIQILKFLVWLEMDLGMHLSICEWLYL